MSVRRQRGLLFGEEAKATMSITLATHLFTTFTHTVETTSKNRNDAGGMKIISSGRCSQFTSGAAEGDTETQHEKMEDTEEEHRTPVIFKIRLHEIDGKNYHTKSLE